MTRPSRARVFSGWTVAFFVGFVHVSIAIFNEANAADASAPLFRSDSVLELRIVAPIAKILSQRQTEEEISGSLHYTDSAGQRSKLDIRVRTRGKFRNNKNICKFPPLRLNFRKSQTKNTLFDQQDKIKLVTHCRPQALYEQTVLREYIAYRILNTLTNISFNVRLLHITYVDSENDDSELTRYGFFIEHREGLAQRLDKLVIDSQKTTVDRVDSAYMNTVSLFHFLIGNTDFSPIAARAGQSCCHNHVLFGNGDGPHWSVPYDFDQSGFVDAPYGTTNPRFKLRNARERLYRGRCVNNERLGETIKLFIAKRGDIRTLIRSTVNVNKPHVRAMSTFVDRFYKRLESERYVEKKLRKKCL